METRKKKSNVKGFKKQIERLVTPIFNRVLQEKNSNSMTTIKDYEIPLKILWRPHNYRRRLTVKLKTNSTITKVLSAIEPTKEIQINFNEHTKLISIHNYKGITIQYGKRTLTGIYTQDKIYGEKQTYLIEANTLKDLEKRITQKKEQIRKKIDNALISFSRQFKIKLPLEKIIWGRYENWIKGEEFIDKIPKEVIIHDTYFKKVYPIGIETKNTGKKDEDPVVTIKNHLSNSMIRKISPEIAESLSKIALRSTQINQNQEKLLNILPTTLEQISSQNQANLTQITKIADSMNTFAIAMEQHLLLIKELQQVTKSMNQSIDEMRELRKPFFKRWFRRK